MKRVLSENYLALSRATPQINIGHKTKSLIPNNILKRIVYDSIFKELNNNNNNTEQDISFQLFVFGNLLKIEILPYSQLYNNIKDKLHTLL